MMYFDDYQSPPYIPPTQGERPVQSAPVQPVAPYLPLAPYGSELTTGTEYTGVSRVGPSVSVQPRANLPVGVPAGSLLGARYTPSSYAPAYRGRVPLQRGFSVEPEERLRRRRKGRPF